MALYLEEHEPSLQATLLSAVESSRNGIAAESAALVQKVVEQAIEAVSRMDAARRADQAPLKRWALGLGGVAAAAVLIVMVGPAFLRNAASALLLVSRSIEAAVPYRLYVEPGNKTVPKGADQAVKVKLFGFNSDDVVLMSAAEHGVGHAELGRSAARAQRRRHVGRDALRRAGASRSTRSSRTA